eukprot:scaffold20497_cov119-Isochrysis_galbana.AAC.1
MVQSDFGSDKWDAIVSALDLPDDSTITDITTSYEDAVTVAGVTAACEVLGVSWDDALRAFGAFFVRFLHTGQHLRMFHSMGDNLVGLLQNVNQLHFHLERTYRSTNFPVFHVETEEATAGRDTCTLSYSSIRGAALSALLEGIVPQARGGIEGARGEWRGGNHKRVERRGQGCEKGPDSLWRKGAEGGKGAREPKGGPESLGGG